MRPRGGRNDTLEVKIPARAAGMQQGARHTGRSRKGGLPHANHFLSCRVTAGCLWRGVRAGLSQAADGFVVPLPPGIWLGVTMPANVPAPIVTTSPQALAQLIREDYARWGKIIKAAGIKAD